MQARHLDDRLRPKVPNVRKKFIGDGMRFAVSINGWRGCAAARPSGHGWSLRSVEPDRFFPVRTVERSLMKPFSIITTWRVKFRFFNGCLAATLVCALVIMHAAEGDAEFCGAPWSDSTDASESVELSLPRSATTAAVSSSKPRRRNSRTTFFNTLQRSAPLRETLRCCNGTFRPEYAFFNGVGSPLLL